jgi:hypothetical protein
MTALPADSRRSPTSSLNAQLKRLLPTS